MAAIRRRESVTLNEDDVRQLLLGEDSGRVVVPAEFELQPRNEPMVMVGMDSPPHSNTTDDIQVRHRTWYGPLPKLQGSALACFGLSFHAGAEEVGAGAFFCLVILHLPFFIVTLIAVRIWSEDESEHGKSLAWWQLGWTVAVILGAGIVIDCALIFVAFTVGQIRQRNQIVVHILHIRILMSVLEFMWAIGALITITLSYSEDGRILTKPLPLAIFFDMNMLIIGIVAKVCCCMCLIAPTRSDDQIWDRRVNAFLWLCAPASESTLTTAANVSLHFQSLFNDVERFSFSDVAIGMLLVRSVQAQQRKNGKFAHLQDPPHDRLLVDAALRGTQPPLSDSDQVRILDAQHYVSHAIAVYGYPLELLMYPSRCCTICLPRLWSDDHRTNGAGCCCSMVNSFSRQSGIPENLILFANTTAEHGRNAYFVFIDSKTSCVVIAIRGTLSLDDCFTDVDANPDSLKDLGFDGHWGHAGAKVAALRIKEEVFSQPGVNNALEHFRKLRIVGHSLGAASSVMLTLALSQELHGIDLHCFAFGPPLLLDEQLAKSEKARSLISSFVYRDDVAPRLSLHTVRKLKATVLRCFELANKSRWDVLSARISGRLDQLFDAEFAEDPDFLNLDRDVMSRIQVELAQERIRLRESIAQHGVFCEELFQPGRVFQIQSERIDESRRWVTCFPADHQMYGEIVVSPSMGTDHMPQAYLYRIRALSVGNN